MDEQTNLSTDTDIQQALQDFGTQATVAAQAQAQTQQTNPIVVEGSAITRLVIKLSGGAITDESQANHVLIAVCVLCFSAAVGLVLYSFFGISTTPPKPTPAMLQKMTQMVPAQ